MVAEMAATVAFGAIRRLVGGRGQPPRAGPRPYPVPERPRGP